MHDLVNRKSYYSFFKHPDVGQKLFGWVFLSMKSHWTKPYLENIIFDRRSDSIVYRIKIPHATSWPVVWLAGCNGWLLVPAPKMSVFKPVFTQQKKKHKSPNRNQFREPAVFIFISTLVIKICWCVVLANKKWWYGS